MTHDQIAAEAQRIQRTIEDVQRRVQALQDAHPEAPPAERTALADADAGLEQAYMSLAAFT